MALRMECVGGPTLVAADSPESGRFSDTDALDGYPD